MVSWHRAILMIVFKFQPAKLGTLGMFLSIFEKNILSSLGVRMSREFIGRPGAVIEGAQER